MNATKHIGGAAALAASIVLAAAVAAAVLAAPGAAHASTLAAADFASNGKVVTSYLKGDDGNARSYRTTKKVTSLSSSDPKVVSARLAPGGRGFDVTVKKAGKAKLTYGLGGARRTVTFKAVKYANPVKSFKVGSKDFAKKFKKAKSYRLASKQRNMGKLRVTAAKGWKVKKMYSGFSERNSLKVRNGDRLGGALNVRVVLANKKTGVVETIEFRNGV